MSKRNRGDHADQPLLPLPGVERITAPGKITSTLILATVTEPTTPALRDKPIVPDKLVEPSKPTVTDSAPTITPSASTTTAASAASIFPPRAYAQPLWEGGAEWGAFRFWFRSNDARPWYAKLAQDGLRQFIIQMLLRGVLFLCALSAAPTPAGNAPESGWTTVIERAP